MCLDTNYAFAECPHVVYHSRTWCQSNLDVFIDNRLNGRQQPPEDQCQSPHQADRQTQPIRVNFPGRCPKCNNPKVHGRKTWLVGWRELNECVVGPPQWKPQHFKRNYPTVPWTPPNPLAPRPIQVPPPNRPAPPPTGPILPRTSFGAPGPITHEARDSIADLSTKEGWNRSLQAELERMWNASGIRAIPREKFDEEERGNAIRNLRNRYAHDSQVIGGQPSSGPPPGEEQSNQSREEDIESMLDHARRNFPDREPPSEDSQEVAMSGASFVKRTASQRKSRSASAEASGLGSPEGTKRRRASPVRSQHRPRRSIGPPLDTGVTEFTQLGSSQPRQRTNRPEDSSRRAIQGTGSSRPQQQHPLPEPPEARRASERRATGGRAPSELPPFHPRPASPDDDEAGRHPGCRPQLQERMQSMSLEPGSRSRSNSVRDEPPRQRSLADSTSPAPVSSSARTAPTSSTQQRVAPPSAPTSFSTVSGRSNPLPKAGGATAERHAGEPTPRPSAGTKASSNAGAKSGPSDPSHKAKPNKDDSKRRQRK